MQVVDVATDQDARRDRASNFARVAADLATQPVELSAHLPVRIDGAGRHVPLVGEARHQRQGQASAATTYQKRNVPVDQLAADAL